MKTLFIVESPGKKQKISKILGPSYNVQASFGHIRDLPSRQLGVDTETWRATYESKNDKAIKNLKYHMKDCNGRVIIATDDDREGEAIGWHIAAVLGLNLSNTPRAVFSEITDNALKKAVKDSETRRIDMKKVAAQEARRILDRILGYKVSSPLSFFLSNYSNLSAGRVQSVAVKLVAQREEDINNFVPTDHYMLSGTFKKNSIEFKAQWDFKKHFDGSNPPASINNGEIEYWKDKNHLLAIAKQINSNPSCVVTALEEKPSKRKPAAPFITSSFQMACSTKFKMSPKKAMEVAQKLYEDGLITYMRTDNPNLSDETIGLVNDYIDQWCTAQGLESTKYKLTKPNKWKAKGDAQEAHEAIRPTDFNCSGNNIADPEHKKVYQMILQRTVACQMASAIYDSTSVSIETSVECNGKPIVFSAKGNVLVFPGWKAFVANDEMSEPDDENSDDDTEGALPPLNNGEDLPCQKAQVLDKKTKPPARFTEASLIKALESEGIGRPATYAAIMENIIRRQYVEIIDKKSLKMGATKKGIDVYKVLDKSFSFMQVSYTQQTEVSLDSIAKGALGFKNFMNNFYESFKRESDTFNLEAEKKSTAPTCPTCKERKMFKVKNKNRPGNSWLCRGFTDDTCKTAFPDKNGKPDFDYVPPQITDHSCPSCDGKLTRFKNENGFAFYCKPCKKSLEGDENSPDWQLYKVKMAAREKAETCPSCNKGKLLLRNGRYGEYFSCDNYPKCSTIISKDQDNKPDIEAYLAKKKELESLPSCPKCKKGKLVIRKGSKGEFKSCSAYPKCKHTEDMEKKTA